MNHPGKIPEWYKEKLKDKFNPWELLFFVIKSNIKCHYFGYCINLFV